MTGYPDLRSHAEAMDAIRMAPDAWSCAIFALDRAAPRMFLGWGPMLTLVFCFSVLAAGLLLADRRWSR